MNIDPTIFKAYDIRGVYPEQINLEIAYSIAQGYVSVVEPKGEVLVGHDVRIHSPEIKAQVIAGLIDAGTDVVDVGLISTDMYYFGVGKYGLAGGIQVTSSHNPPQWHGVKMVRENVIPLTGEAGIYDIRDFVQSGKTLTSPIKGKVRQLDILDDLCDYALSWLTVPSVKPFKVVYNPNFGFAGKVFEKIVARGSLPLELIPLNANPDGTFPKGRPDPFIPENRTETTQLVKDTHSDFGIAWDADADRVFFCADGGLFLEPYLFNTLLIKVMLQKHPGSKVIYDPRYTWALEDAIKEGGGQPILVRVGHSYIKEAMRKYDAVIALESSGHTYYRDFWYADSGVIPVMQLLNILSSSSEPLSSLMKSVLNRYFISGEINRKVADPQSIIKRLSEKYSDVQTDTLDGLSIEYPDFRFNVRTSNTEPLLRLNLEAKSQELVKVKKQEVLSIIDLNLSDNTPV